MMNSGEEQAENLVKKSEEKKDHYYVFSQWIKGQGFLGTLALLKVVLQPKSVSYMANMIFGCHGRHILD